MKGTEAFQVMGIIATTNYNNQQLYKQVNLKGRYLVEITRELDKESLLYFYTIYIKSLQSVLTLNSSTLMSIYQL